jgi:hypothetical protein
MPQRVNNQEARAESPLHGRVLRQPLETCPYTLLLLWKTGNPNNALGFCMEFVASVVVTLKTPFISASGITFLVDRQAIADL